jgi:hypothetical protein
MTSVSLEGGAFVRVVAGTFSRVSIPPPLHDFVSSALFFFFLLLHLLQLYL